MKGIFHSVRKASGLLVILLLMAACGSNGGTSPSDGGTSPSDNNFLNTELSGSYSIGDISRPLQVGTSDIYVLYFSYSNESISSVDIKLVLPTNATLHPNTETSPAIPLVEVDGQKIFTTTHNFTGNAGYPYVMVVTNGDSRIAKWYVMRAAPIAKESRSVYAFSIFRFRNPSAGMKENIKFNSDGNTTLTTLRGRATDVKVSALVPSIIHNAKSIFPADGVPQDFSTNLTYTVTAYNNTTRKYQVILDLFNSIIFDANGGSYSSGTTYTNEIPHGSIVTDITVKPTREGYGFHGWSATPGGGLYVFNTPITSPITLYALWTNK